MFVLKQFSEELTMGQLNATDDCGQGRSPRLSLGEGRMRGFLTNWLARRSGRTNGTQPHASVPGDESGAVLILALVFLVTVGGVVGSLSTWAMNDLSNTTHFTSARTLQYAVNGAVETAVQNIRYTPQLSTTQNASAPGAPCWGTSSSSQVTINGTNVAVWCSTVWNQASGLSTRVVTFLACPVPAGQSAVALAASCATSPTLTAVVAYGDYPTGNNAPNSAECVLYCGTSMTVDSWIWA
jgi:hypothetical protein